MKEFINTDRYGKFYYDKILFEAPYPIIFSCKNEYGEIFIGVCCQYNEQAHRWLLGKTEPTNIVRVLRDEMTIRQLLTEYCSKRMSVAYMNGAYVMDYHSDDWEKDSIYLPKKDSYMWAEPGEFDEEIEYFLSIKNNLNYEPDSYINILEKNEVIYKDKVSIAGEGLQVRYAEELTIPSEIVNTLNVYGNKQEEYNFSISLSGYFTIDTTENLEDKFIQDLVNRNAVAILMPYLRSELTLLTAQPEMEGVVLPPFNINKMLEQAE